MEQPEIRATMHSTHLNTRHNRTQNPQILKENISQDKSRLSSANSRLLQVLVTASELNMGTGIIEIVRETAALVLRLERYRMAVTPPIFPCPPQMERGREWREEAKNSACGLMVELMDLSLGTATVQNYVAF